MFAVAEELFGTPPDQSDASDQSPLAETFQVDVVNGGSHSSRGRKRSIILCGAHGGATEEVRHLEICRMSADNEEVDARMRHACPPGTSDTAKFARVAPLLANSPS